MQISVLPPNINKSNSICSIEQTEDGARNIRFGLSSIKNVGLAAVDPIVESRIDTGGTFKSIEHMCREADLKGLNSKVLESLIKAGALDDFGTRGGLLESLNRILKLSQSEMSLKQSDQGSMFDLFGESVPVPLSHITIPDIDTPTAEQQSWELELLGVDLNSNQSLSAIFSDIDTNSIVSRNQISQSMDGHKIVLVGQVKSITERLTKQGNPYTIASLQLQHGDIDVFVWENILSTTHELWTSSALLTVVGTIRARGDQISISCVSANKYDINSHRETSDQTTGTISSPSATNQTQEEKKVSISTPKNESSEVHTATNTENARLQLCVKLRESDDTENDARLLDEIIRLLLEFRGKNPVVMEVDTNGHSVYLDWPLIQVSISQELEDRLGKLLSANGDFQIIEI